MIFPDARDELRASALTITLRPDAARQIVTALHGTNVSVYHHLGCGTLGANISIRRLIPTEEQLERLEEINLHNLLEPFGVSDALPYECFSAICTTHNGRRT